MKLRGGRCGGAGRFGSVRWRTAIAASAALAPVLLIGGGALVVYQRHQLTDASALVAEDQARAVANVGRDRSGPPGAALPSSGAGEATLLQVIDGNGAIVAASPELRGRGALAPSPAQGAVTRRQVSGLEQGEGDRYVVVAAATGSGGGYVIAAKSLESVDTATASTTGLLAVSVPLLLVVVTGLGYVLAGRALRPVEDMRRHASEITAADLSARLPTQHTGDEIARLATTMNAMLGRLERAAETQRRFVADASHELRSPVATIRTLHEVAQRTPDTDWNELCDDVLAETTRLECLVAGLLLLARADAGATPPFSTVDIIDVVRGEATREARLPVAVHLGSPAHSILVRGHADSLGRALRNLLDNAERHGERQVEVRVFVEVFPSTMVRIVVTDDGHGIADVDLERVFERFVRLDEARTRDDGGAGLGLSIARQIAHWHGGTLTASASSAGGMFELVLPLLRDVTAD